MKPITQDKCPASATLDAWFDGLLAESDAAAIETHLEACNECRDRLSSWGEGVGDRPRDDEDAASRCLDDELLVAYGVAAETLATNDISSIEHHLRTCSHCVTALQQVMDLHRQYEPPTLERARGAAVVVPPVGVSLEQRLALWRERVRELFQNALLPVRLPLGALATIILLIGISRFFTPGGFDETLVRDMGQRETLEIAADTPGLARPDPDEPVVLRLRRGSRVFVIERTPDWVRVELDDGRRVWVRSSDVTGTQNE